MIETIGEVFNLEPKIETKGPGTRVNLLCGAYDLKKLGDTVGLPVVPFREGLARLKKNMTEERREG